MWLSYLLLSLSVVQTDSSDLGARFVLVDELAHQVEVLLLETVHAGLEVMARPGVEVLRAHPPLHALTYVVILVLELLDRLPLVVDVLGPIGELEPLPFLVGVRISPHERPAAVDAFGEPVAKVHVAVHEADDNEVREDADEQRLHRTTGTDRRRRLQPGAEHVRVGAGALREVRDALM